MEVNTAKRLAEEMRKIGYEVTEKVGGNGIVCVLKNGEGPVVLIRTDMDGLPIVEQTGLSYASKVKVKNHGDGIEVGVMHALWLRHPHGELGRNCSHVGRDERQVERNSCVHRPTGGRDCRRGAAKQMLDAPDFTTKFPKPDYALALHSDPLRPAELAHYSEGDACAANSDTVEHSRERAKARTGASPHLSALTPLSLSARIILDLRKPS